MPVLRNAERKGLIEIARELATISARARDGKLKAEDMQGGCFTISSLGGIGGSYFTPILNLPKSPYWAFLAPKPSRNGRVKNLPRV